MHLPRLNRLFAADGRCLGVAIDHGVMGEPSWLGHLLDIEQVITGPDQLRWLRPAHHTTIFFLGSRAPLIARTALDVGGPM